MTWTQNWIESSLPRLGGPVRIPPGGQKPACASSMQGFNAGNWGAREPQAAKHNQDFSCRVGSVFPLGRSPSCHSRHPGPHLERLCPTPAAGRNPLSCLGSHFILWWRQSWRGAGTLSRHQRIPRWIHLVWINPETSEQLRCVGDCGTSPPRAAATGGCHLEASGDPAQFPGQALPAPSRGLPAGVVTNGRYLRVGGPSRCRPLSGTD